MSLIKSDRLFNNDIGYRGIVGITLISLGLGTLIDHYFNTGGLAYIILLLESLFFFFLGFRNSQYGYLIIGSLLCGFSIGVFILFNPFVDIIMKNRAGLSLLVFSLGWETVTVLSPFYIRKIAWWALIPGVVIGSTGACLLFSGLRVVDFILYILLSLGVVFLLWGINRHLFGLIIPGCILSSCGIGVYLAWGLRGEPNALSRTGIMLVCFGLGWGLITIFSRILVEKFVWWPLIPAGTLAVVGWGLYIGGNPGNALGFISNTGSIGLIIFGFYLLLMRRGMHQ